MTTQQDASSGGQAPIRADVLAGLTVAVVGLPQAVAYAILSGMPPVYGLVTAAIPGLVAAALGRSAQVVTGPTNTTALMILAALAPWLDATGLVGTGGLAVVATLTLLAGLWRLAAVLVGGDRLLRFLPESVLVGFTAGAGLLIAAMQLDEALGLPPVRAGNLIEQVTGLWDAARGGALPSPGAVALAVGTTALALSLRRTSAGRFVPLLVLVIGSALAWAFDLRAAQGVPLVGDRIAPPGSGWPPFAWPSLAPSTVGPLLGPAAAIALLGTLELAVGARAGGARPDLRREIVAQGAANIAGALVGAFPASSSLTRSVLLRMAGARTRLAAALSATLTAIVLLVAAPTLGWLPQPILAGILFATAWAMVDTKRVARMWRTNPTTRLLLVSTVLLTQLTRLDIAIVTACGLGLLLFLGESATPRLALLVPLGGRLVPPRIDEVPAAVVVEVTGSLHYAAVPAFEEAFEALVPAGAAIVVLDLSHATGVRFAALSALEELERRLAARGQTLSLAGVGEQVEALLVRSESSLPWTPASPEPGRSARDALARLRGDGDVSDADPASLI